LNVIKTNQIHAHSILNSYHFPELCPKATRACFQCSCSDHNIFITGFFFFFSISNQRCIKSVRHPQIHKKYTRKLNITRYNSLHKKEHIPARVNTLLFTLKTMGTLVTQEVYAHILVYFIYSVIVYQFWGCMYLKKGRKKNLTEVEGILQMQQ
jgi:hypothetical protein